MKFAIVYYGLIYLFDGIYGIPVMNQVRATDPSTVETPKTKDQISIQPPWSFPSIPPMNRLFRNVEFDENDIKLLTRRIENLERSQKEIYELMKKIPQSTCHSSPCNCKASTKIENLTPAAPKPKEMIDEKKSPIPTVISSTTTMPSTIDYALEDIAKVSLASSSSYSSSSTSASLKPLKNEKSKTIAPVKREQFTMTTTSENPIDKSIITLSGNTSGNNNKTKFKISSDEIQRVSD